ncbi:hypothetical protein ACTL32_09495 [Planococcus sp. FY231025]|uniref:hypothetical protein n=1 Tax=Planococcus sp. FY231025 TaxID=3455699 RepID=UPI003F910F1B
MAAENNGVTQEQLDQEHAKLVEYQETLNLMLSKDEVTAEDWETLDLISKDLERVLELLNSTESTQNSVRNFFLN